MMSGSRPLSAESSIVLNTLQEQIQWARIQSFELGSRYQLQGLLCVSTQEFLSLCKQINLMRKQMRILTAATKCDLQADYAAIN